MHLHFTPSQIKNMTDSDSLLRPAFAGARLLVLDEVSDAKQLGSPPALYRETLRTLYAPEAGRYAYSSSIADSTAPSWGEPVPYTHLTLPTICSR